MTAIARRVRSGDIELAVYTWGERGIRPPIVLVHGYPDTHAVWTAVAEQLATRHFVIAYDVRGAGASTAPATTEGYALDVLVDDLVAVLDATAGGRAVHLVGHDWGSIQSWEAVTDARTRGRIASFTSISGPCLDHVGHWLRAQPIGAVAAQAVRSWYVGAFQLPGAGLAWRAISRAWPDAFTRITGAPAISDDDSTRARDGERGVALYRANVADRLARPRDRRTDVPVQLIVPTRDRFVGTHLTDDLERWAPNLRRRAVVADHWLPISHPALLARAIAEHAADIEGGKLAGSAQRRAGPLAGQLAVVTGAGSGIGRATVFELVERGADVIAADLDLDAARVTAELGALLGGTVHAQRVDVADAVAMTEFAARVAREHGAPHIVVNNAGIALAGGFLATTAAEWDRVLGVNLGGVVHGCRLFARQMIDDGRPGHIINVASAAAFAPSRALAAYATSKAAVVMLTECLRAELASSGIRVGAVCPGFVATNITTATRFAGEDAAHEARRRRAITRLYRRRGLTADDVARAIGAAIADDRPVSLVGAEAVGIHWLHRLAPSLGRRLAQIDLDSATSSRGGN